MDIVQEAEEVAEKRKWQEDRGRMSENHTERTKICFVIAPVGESSSPTRARSDKVLRHIITPAAEGCGYEVIRSDRESQPGMIGSQIINHLLDDDLVIADLTDHNPNVFYELAIRHAVAKPAVQIMQAGQRLPFDVIQSRTIFFDHTDLDSAADCRNQLGLQIRAVEKDPSLVDSPITQAVKLKALDQSPDPEQKRDAQIFHMLQDLARRVERLTAVVIPSTTNPSQYARPEPTHAERLLEELKREPAFWALSDADKANAFRKVRLADVLQQWDDPSMARIYFGAMLNRGLTPEQVTPPSQGE